MPTGYTYGVQEGNVTTLDAFAQECARAFLWQSRDSNEKDLIKLVTIPNDVEYQKNQLVKAKENLNELLALTETEWRTRYEEEKADDIRRQQERNERLKTEQARYNAMIEKVEAWTPPTEKHEDLKEFMLDQLAKSLDFDCSDRMLYPCTFQEYDSWKSHQLAYARGDVMRAENNLDRVTKRDGDYLEWVNKLLESVKGL